MPAFFWYPERLLLSYFISFISPRKLFSSLLFQLFKFVRHPLLKTIYLFSSHFSELSWLSSQKCVIDSEDLMSSCLAYVTPANKLLCWIMYHMYIWKVVLELWSHITALMVCFLDQGFCPFRPSKYDATNWNKILSSPSLLWSILLCLSHPENMCWEKPTVMICWGKKLCLLVDAHLCCNTCVFLCDVFAYMWCLRV